MPIDSAPPCVICMNVTKAPIPQGSSMNCACWHPDLDPTLLELCFLESAYGKNPCGYLRQAAAIPGRAHQSRCEDPTSNNAQTGIEHVGSGCRAAHFSMFAVMASMSKHNSADLNIASNTYSHGRNFLQTCEAEVSCINSSTTCRVSVDMVTANKGPFITGESLQVCLK